MRGQEGKQGGRSRTRRANGGTAPQTLARRLGCQAIGGPLAQGLAYGGCHYQSLDNAAPRGGPGSGHARHPHQPQEAHRGDQTHTPAAALPQGSRRAHRPESRAERRIERKQIADQLGAGPEDSARVRDDEISGHGSSAAWAHNRHKEPEPTSERPAAKRIIPVVGKRTELARYTVAEGERIVYGQRIDGVVRVTDRPASPGGRCYLVERDLKSKDELDALVADYVAQARRMGAPPLATSPLDRYLDAVT
jgi:hypothetical protein